MSCYISKFADIAELLRREERPVHGMRGDVIIVTLLEHDYQAPNLDNRVMILSTKTDSI